MKRSTARNEQPRLRRVHLPGTVPSPSPAAPRPQDAEEKREASATDTARQVVE
ncbi:hypothetical protein [Streptomyces justiciae]|uniref:hypothetical protein n=1 Tax=Streptomyces justiciae TaxID=2780140 RepID=UPI00187ECA80|nr:hypothetical protein [Streptomyces justiciae]MBE8478463.1 hypothetical protein [Streptomyces justiciae]MCW8384626.1 hypothetical protein [Streptomyces justiciae]